MAASIEATNPQPFQPVFFKLSAFTVGQKSALVSQVLVLDETKSISIRPVSVDLEDSWKSEGEEGGIGWPIKSSSDGFDNRGFLEQLCRVRNICLNLHIHFYPISRERTCCSLPS
jgi:hypothetical protein